MGILLKKQNEGFKYKFVAMAIGNILEWFDFAIFGALADILGNSFSLVNILFIIIYWVILFL
jgi:hypothetical protein